MKFIKKYIPDVMIQVGVFLFFSIVFRHPDGPLYGAVALRVRHDFFVYEYTNSLKLLAVLLISLGINIAIRRYFKK